MFDSLMLSSQSCPSKQIHPHYACVNYSSQSQYEAVSFVHLNTVSIWLLQGDVLDCKIALNMEWFSGTVEDAVQRSINGNKIFIVYIEGLKIIVYCKRELWMKRSILHVSESQVNHQINQQINFYPHRWRWRIQENEWYLEGSNSCQVPFCW